LLGQGEVEAGECDVVIGGEKSDQAEDQAAEGLEDARAVEAGPGEFQF